MRARLGELADKVEAGEIGPAVAHAISALANVRIRSIEIERKLVEAETFEQRIAVLEGLVREGGGRRWRA